MPAQPRTAPLVGLNRSIARSRACGAPADTLLGGWTMSLIVPARCDCREPRARTYAVRVTTAVSSASSPTALSEATSSDASLRRFLHGLPGVDQVGAEARAASLSTRSIKTTAKEFALDLAVRMVDLTTLEGADTPGKVRALASKAMRPDPADPDCPAVAAV